MSPLGLRPPQVVTLDGLYWARRDKVNERSTFERNGPRTLRRRHVRARLGLPLLALPSAGVAPPRCVQLGGRDPLALKIDAQGFDVSAALIGGRAVPPADFEAFVVKVEATGKHTDLFCYARSEAAAVLQ